MNHQNIPEFLADLYNSPLFDKDEGFASLAKSVSESIITKVAAKKRTTQKKVPPIQFSPEEVIQKIGELASNTSEYPVVREALTRLYNISSGRASIPELSPEFQRNLIEYYAAKGKVSIADVVNVDKQNVSSYVNEIYKSIAEFKQYLTKDDAEKLAKVISSQITKAFEKSEDFDSNARQAVSDIWHAYIDSVLAYEAMNAQGKVKGKKTDAGHRVLEALEQTDVSQYLLMDRKDIGEALSQALTSKAFQLSGGPTSAVKKANAIEDSFRIVISQTGATFTPEQSQFFAETQEAIYWSLLAQAYQKASNETKKLLDSLPAFSQQKNKLLGYKNLTKLFSNPKNLKPEVRSLQFIKDAQISANLDAIRNRLDDIQQGIAKSVVDWNFDVTNAPKLIQDGLTDALSKITQQPWGKFSAEQSTQVSSITEGIRKQIPFIVSDLEQAIARSKAAFAAFKTPENFVRFMSYYCALSFLARAQTMGLIRPEYNVALESFIKMCVDGMGHLTNMYSQLPFVAKVLEALRRGGMASGLDKETAQAIFNQLKAQMRQKIETAAKERPDKWIFSEIAKNLESPWVVQKYMGNNAVTTGHHGQAMLYVERLRRGGRIEPNSATQYLMSNIERWGQTASTGEAWGDTVKEFPKFTNPANTDTPVQTNQVVEKEPEMPYGENWLDPNVIGLASAILYALYLQTHGQYYYGW